MTSEAASKRLLINQINRVLRVLGLPALPLLEICQEELFTILYDLQTFAMSEDDNQRNLWKAKLLNEVGCESSIPKFDKIK